MSAQESSLPQRWLAVLPARSLKAGVMDGRIIADQPVVFWRNEAGQVCAVRDLCPHRGVPFSAGRLVEGGRELECPYHGWRFGADGRCAAIPSMVDGQQSDSSRIRVRRYPVAERQGLIWIWIPEGPADAPVLPDAPEPETRAPQIADAPDAAPVMAWTETMSVSAGEGASGIETVPAHGIISLGLWELAWLVADAPAQPGCVMRLRALWRRSGPPAAGLALMGRGALAARLDAAMRGEARTGA